MIFGREGNMAWSGEVTALYRDGTFEQVPLLFRHRIMLWWAWITRWVKWNEITFGWV